MEKHEKETWAAEAAADAPKSRQSRAILRAAAEKALALLFWILIWALAAKILNKPLLVSTPWETFRTILRMLSEADFWSATLQTFLRMLGGFGIAIFSAFVLSVLSAKLRPVRILAETPRAFMAGVPLAAFVILGRRKKEVAKIYNVRV